MKLHLYKLKHFLLIILLTLTLLLMSIVTYAQYGDTGGDTGSGSITFDDGTVMEWDGQGTVVQTDTDGTVTTYDPDGTTTVTTPEEEGGGIWGWIEDNIIDPVVEVIEPIVEWIDENIYEPYIEPIVEWIDENIYEPYIEPIVEWIDENIYEPYIEPIVEWIDENIIDPIVEVIEPIVEWIDENIIDPIVEVIEPIVEVIVPNPCEADPVCCGNYGTKCGPCGFDCCPGVGCLSGGGCGGTDECGNDCGSGNIGTGCLQGGGCGGTDACDFACSTERMSEKGCSDSVPCQEYTFCTGAYTVKDSCGGCPVGRVCSNGACEGCTGSISLSLSEDIVGVSKIVTPTASGLSGCGGKKVYFRLGDCNTYTVTMSTCLIGMGGTGCIGETFAAPAVEGNFQYYACIDKDGDGYFD